MDYDVIIIGAGLSGIAAGIRLAHYDKRVCILERHSLVGGLNSFYKKDGRAFDVGLHAVTNFPNPKDRRAPLNKLFRQLRFKRADFEMCEQGYSTIEFPNHKLEFSNDAQHLAEQIAELFPEQIDGYRRLVEKIKCNDSTALQGEFVSTRKVMGNFISDAVLADMILCPVMFYGNADEMDMDFNQFCIMFQSLYLEGFWRPRLGVRQLLSMLVERFKSNGGELRMNCGVRKIHLNNGEYSHVTLDSGEVITSKKILSSAGYVETLQICDELHSDLVEHPQGKLGYIESIFVLDKSPAELGHEASITFFSEQEKFRYEKPAEFADFSSGVLCAPTNFLYPVENLPEPKLRLTNLANSDFWLNQPDASYAELKRLAEEQQLAFLERTIPNVRQHIIYTDMFTPQTIVRYTGHLNGAIYGSPRKRRDGSTPFKNLFICGTDQGFLGIVGTLLSGVSMANYHLLG